MVTNFRTTGTGETVPPGTGLPTDPRPGSQLSLGDLLKAEGMQRADLAASPDWKEMWDDAIALLAASGQRFTSDDVREIAGPPRDHANAAGSRFLIAARNGLIRKVGYRNSPRPSLHSHPTAEWVGR